MAYYDDPLVDPDGFAQEQALLDQQAARIKALRQRAAQPWEPSLKEIGGFTLSTQTPGAAPTHIPGRIAPATWGSALSALAPLVADYTAGQQEKELAQRTGALDARQRKAALDWAGNIPQDTPYSAVPLPGHTGGTGGNLVEATVTPAAPADPAKVLKHAVAGLNNKYSAKSAQALLDAQTVDIPKETRQREFLTQQEVNKTNAQFVLESQKEKNAAAQKALDRANARDVATIRANAVGGAGHNLTYMGVDPNDPTKGLWVDPRNPTAPPIRSDVGKTQPEKQLPVAMSNKLVSNNTLDAKLTALIGDKSADDATGYLKGKVIGLLGEEGNALVNIFETNDGKARRAAIAKIAATEVHDMSGATVTVAEYPRLRPFIPLMTDNAEEVRTKLINMRAAIREENAQIQMIAETQGYKMPRVGPSGNQGGGQPAGPTAAPKPGDVVDGYRFKGGNTKDPKNWEKV